MARATDQPGDRRDFVHQLLTNRVVFGAGRRHDVRLELERLAAQRVLVIAEPAARDVLDELLTTLPAQPRLVTTDVHPHVPRDQVDELHARAASAGIDTVVTIGGGSATGLAKALALVADVRIVAVPTTYAGSEVTSIWGITTAGQKQTGRDIRVLPAVVVYDPELTLSLPLDVSAASALNSIAHCVEALYAPRVSPIVTLLATESIGAMLRALDVLVGSPTDLAARTEALYAAWLAGVCLANAQMGIHHKLAHLLGGMFDLPHARLHASLLPYTVAFTEPRVDPVLRPVAAALQSETAAVGLWRLGRDLGVTTDGLRGLGVDPTRLAEVAERADLGSAHPTRLDVLDILGRATTGNRPDLYGPGGPPR